MLPKLHKKYSKAVLDKIRLGKEIQMKRFGIVIIILIVSIFISISSCNRQTVPAEKKEIQDENYKPYIRTIEKDGAKAEIDLTTQVLSLDLPVIEMFRETDELLFPSLDKINNDIKFISTSMVIAKMKQFDDGLYAAVELKLQEGSKNFIGKENLLKKIKKILDNNKDIYKYELEFIENAIKLGEGEELDLKKLESKYNLLENDLKPIGFYTWDEDFENIFKQDRLLQAALDSIFVKKIQVIFKDDSIRNDYTAYTDFLQKFTNPFPKNYFNLFKQKPVFSKQDNYFFFPPCTSYESKLYKSKFSTKLPPDDYSIMDDLIDSIKQRKVNLIPTDISGWYDYKTYSLEPFLIPDSLPESKNLKFSEKYKKELVELFKGALALARETHIKNLVRDITTSCRIPNKIISINTSPCLKFEPTMTFYKRSAEVYSFVRKALLSLFTVEELQELKRISPSNEIQTNLYEELQNMEDLLYGIYYFTAHTIGTEVEYKHDIDQVELLKTNAVKWAETIKSDPDIGTDNRMMVPVFYNVLTKKYKVWMFLGYTSKKLNISYDKKPVFKTESPDKETAVSVSFSGESHDLYTPVFEEIYVDSLLNRNEFREICDKLKTRYNIKKYFGESKYDDDKYKNKLKELGINENDVYQGKLSAISCNDSIFRLDDGDYPVLIINNDNPLFRNLSKNSKEKINISIIGNEIIDIHSNLLSRVYLLNEFVELGKVQFVDGQTKKYMSKIIKIGDSGAISFELINNFQKLLLKVYSHKIEITE